MSLHKTIKCGLYARPGFHLENVGPQIIAWNGSDKVKEGSRGAAHDNFRRS